jgi:hypothetical protein
MSDKNWAHLIETGMHIVQNPDQWSQLHWSGARACFGGRALTLAGFAFAGTSLWGAISGHPDMVEVPEAMRPLVKAYFDRYAPNVQFRNSPTTLVHAGAAAAALLGLTLSESSRMFSGLNSLNDIRVLLSDWATADGVELPEELRPTVPSGTSSAVRSCPCPLCAPAHAAGAASPVPNFLPSAWAELFGSPSSVLASV